MNTKSSLNGVGGGTGAAVGAAQEAAESGRRLPWLRPVLRKMDMRDAELAVAGSGSDGGKDS
jgi:hypothetical protein